MWYVFVFITGAVVLVFEILGSRLVAPVYGTTVYVWSAMITVTLAALSIGYAVGGMLADKKAPLKTLGILVAASGIWILIIPLIRRPVLLAMLGLGVQLGSLASAAILLGFPLICLEAIQ